MEQHPIPRNVTGFEFQLIGFMTLKQFFYLLFGAGFGLVFWKAPLGFLSIPLAIVAVLIGVAFAFVPIQERPLEVWIRNFLISIYSPTQFTWHQEGMMPAYLASSQTRSVRKATQQVDESIQQDTRAKLQTYLQSVSEKNTTAIDKQEKSRMNQVSALLKNPDAPIARHQANPKKQTITVKPAQTSSASVGIMSGTVKDDARPLAGILLTVFDLQNQPIRMVTSDNQGHFRTKLPLDPGTYRLVTEDPKKTYQFKQYSFKVAQEPLKPWLISPSGPA